MWHIFERCIDKGCIICTWRDDVVNKNHVECSLHPSHLPNVHHSVTAPRRRVYAMHHTRPYGLGMLMNRIRASEINSWPWSTRPKYVSSVLALAPVFYWPCIVKHFFSRNTADENEHKRLNLSQMLHVLA